MKTYFIYSTYVDKYVDNFHEVKGWSDHCLGVLIAARLDKLSRRMITSGAVNENQLVKE